MPEDLHELSALYALDVLDADERARFERHLDDCERCSTELAGLRDAAAALAFVEGPPPPAELRGLILAEARAEPSNVVPLRSARSVATSVAAVFAVAATAAAVGLGIWAATLNHSLTKERSTTAVLRDPLSRHIDVKGARGELVVAPSGDAVLSVSLPKPPQGKTYEAWVAKSQQVQPAGVFSDGLVMLDRRVPHGAQVLVTLEKSGGTLTPTQQPLLNART
jgi:anti-sigma factor RsiW